MRYFLIFSFLTSTFTYAQTYCAGEQVSLTDQNIEHLVGAPYDEYEIGKSAIKYKVSVLTTISAAQAMIRAIRIFKSGGLEYRSLQNIFNNKKEGELINWNI